jgi:LEA14-like dessication related protein
MARRSFISRHPLLSFILGLVVLGIIAVAVFFAITPRETLMETAREWVVPDPQSARFTVEEVTADSVRGQASIQVNNRLPATITVDSIRFTIQLDNEQLVSGASREAFRIPARTDDDVHIPLHADIREFSRRARDFRQDSATITVLATLFSSLPGVGRREIPVQVSRRIRVPQFPEIAVQSTEVSQLGANGGELRVRIQVTNRNDFPISVNGFSYRFQLGTNVDIQGDNPERLTFQPGTSSTTIPVRLGLSDIERALNTLLTGRGGNYRVSGVMHVSTNQALMGDFDMNFENEGSVQDLLRGAL